MWVFSYSYMSFITPCCVYDITTIGICKYYAALCPCSYYLSLLSNKVHNDIQLRSDFYLEWVQPGAGFPHLHPCRLATSWSHPGWWHGVYLPSGRTGPALDTARRGHQTGRSQSTLVRASEDRVLHCEGLLHASDRPSHAHTATYRKILTTVCLCGAGLIWELGMRRKVRVPCICCCGKHELQKIEHNRNMKKHYSFTCNLGDGFYILRAHLVQTTIICISFLNDSLKFNLPKQHFFSSNIILSINKNYMLKLFKEIDYFLIIKFFLKVIFSVSETYCNQHLK